MPQKKAKVAYAVFVGRNPGIYSTWTEAEKEVKGFPCADHRGYTAEEGGRAKAESEFGRHTAVKEENKDRDTRKTDEQHAKPTLPEEPIRVHVSGHVAQAPSSPQQLQTPPKTLIGKKKARPSSWEVEDELHKKATWVEIDGSLEGAPDFPSEHTLAHTASYIALPATTTSCYPDVSSLKSSISASGTALSLNNSDIIAIAGRSHDLNSSDRGSATTNPDVRGSIDDAAVEADSDDSVLITSGKEEDSGVSVILLDDRGHQKSFAGDEIYPQLRVLKKSTCADLNEAASRDCSISTHHPNAIFDPFSPALDYIASATSSDYGSFPDDVTVLDQISTNNPRTEPGLCAEQLALIEMVMSGKNVFYTGSAGCGKSTVLKHFVALLRKEGKRVDILAPTGRAALEVSGRTLYNYAGWIPRSLGQPLRNLESKACGKKMWKKLTSTQVLIIDEISMVANHVFERLSRIMKSARNSKKPFGGVQIIVTGDFCQLPPVNGFEYCLECGFYLGPVSLEGNYNCGECSAQYKEIDKWTFRSTAWQECDFKYVNLKTLHRQKDAGLKVLLEKRRFGVPYSVDEKWCLLEHESETKDAVRLFPRRAEVKSINNKELAKLSGRALTYLCVDNFWRNPKHDALEEKEQRCPEPMSHALEALEEHPSEAKLVLKKGMLVMLVVNWDLDSSLANGSQGTIVGFEKHDLKLFPEVPRKWDYSSRKNGLIKVFVQRTIVKEWPIVQFLNGRKRTIYPRCMMSELGDDEPFSLLSRTQIPLVAAWAMTVHKAQGMTLSRVIVDLRHSFEQGQDYVALSRAETLRGLTVEGLPEQTKGPDEQVIEFYKSRNLMPAINWNECSDLKGERLEKTG